MGVRREPVGPTNDKGSAINAASKSLPKVKLPHWKAAKLSPFLVCLFFFLTFSTSLSFSLCSQVIFELTSSHFVFFDLLTTQALDLLEKLGDFVGHGSGSFGT
jgi:hypothetical protein